MGAGTQFAEHRIVPAKSRGYSFSFASSLMGAGTQFAEHRIVPAKSRGYSFSFASSLMGAGTTFEAKNAFTNNFSNPLLS